MKDELSEETRTVGDNYRITLLEIKEEQNADKDDCNLPLSWSVWANAGANMSLHVPLL